MRPTKKGRQQLQNRNQYIVVRKVLWKFIHDLFKAFVRVLDDEHITRRLWTSFKQLIEEVEDYLPPISAPPPPPPLSLKAYSEGRE
jgi:hypothetical protein